MGLFNDIELPEIKERDLIKIAITLTDIRVAEILQFVWPDNKLRLTARFGKEYLYDVKDNELYWVMNHAQCTKMGALTTWQTLALYRLESDGYIPYYTRYKDDENDTNK